MEGLFSRITEGQHRAPEACIQILEEPEQNYRPRYESEGHRAPMKGRRNKSSSPTIKILNVPDHTTGKVCVQLVQVDTNDPFPSCHLSGGTEKDVSSSADLTVKFNDLRIQRIICSDVNRKATKGKSNQAKLLFFAYLKTVEGQKTLQAYSEPIFLEPAQGRGTLSAIVPPQGSAGDEFVLLGHKLAPPCVVEFSASINGKDWRAPAEICKDKFPPAKNAILAKVPKLPPNELSAPLVVNVTIYTGRDKMESENQLQFTYFSPGGEVVKPEGIVQCAIPLMTDGRKLLEPQSFNMRTPNSTGYPPSAHYHPASPLSDSWRDEIPASSIPPLGNDADVFQFSYSPQPTTSSMQQLSASSSMQPLPTSPSLQPLPATSSMQPLPTTSSMQPLPAVYSVSHCSSPFCPPSGFSPRSY